MSLHTQVSWQACLLRELRLPSLLDQPLPADGKRVTNCAPLVSFTGNVAPDTRFTILQMPERSSVGHRLNHHCVTSFGDETKYTAAIIIVMIITPMIFCGDAQCWVLRVFACWSVGHILPQQAFKAPGYICTGLLIYFSWLNHFFVQIWLTHSPVCFAGSSTWSDEKHLLSILWAKCRVMLCTLMLINWSNGLIIIGQVK